MLCDVFEWCVVFCDDLNGMARCVHVVMICLRLYSGGVGGNDAHGVA